MSLENARSLPLDQEHLTEVSGGDPEFEAELIQDFLAMAPNLLVEIESAISANDVLAVQRAAHSLKGSSRSLGAVAIGFAAEDLDNLSRCGDLSGADFQFGTLARRFDEFNDFVGEHVEWQAA